MHFKTYKTILSPQNGMNLYRGCLHGCIYCDSRSKCYQMDHDFEDIEVKDNFLPILEDQLRKKRKPVMIGTGAMSDPYIPLEASLCNTRKALELIYEYGCGVSVQTKSSLILRDMDILQKINERAKAVVEVTLTTADEDLCRIIEPNVATTKGREKILEECDKRGIKTVVWLCPFLPFINDTKENLLSLLDICSRHHVYGVLFFGFGLTLREGNREYFYNKLDEHFPGMKEKYIKTFGNSYECSSPRSKELTRILVEECKNRGIVLNNDEVFSFLRTYPIKVEQLSLF